VTTDQMALISADPQVMRRQAIIAGTRVPVSVILDCMAAGTVGWACSQPPCLPSPLPTA
jgi:uncharacterized protein (DUF433 family)